MTITLPGATRNGGARIPTPSRRCGEVPAPTRRVLTPGQMPPLPVLRVYVAADVVAVVQVLIAFAVKATAAAVTGCEVTASAVVRADGGSKQADADHTIAVAVSATAVARFARAGTMDVTVAATATRMVRLVAAATTGVTATAVQLPRLRTPATEAVSVTATADIVAIGGSVPVAASQSVTVTATAAAVPQISVAASASAAVTATATRLIRISALATQSAVVSATADALARISRTAAHSIAVAATAGVRSPMTSMGMVKSGSQSPIIPANTWTDLTSFVVDSSYPGTVLSGGNKLVVDGTGTILVNASVRWTSASTTEKSIRVLVNGVVAATAPVMTGQGAQTGEFTTSVSFGDVLTLQAWCEATNAAYRSISASPTFLRYTVA